MNNHNLMSMRMYLAGLDLDSLALIQKISQLCFLLNLTHLI